MKLMNYSKNSDFSSRTTNSKGYPSSYNSIYGAKSNLLNGYKPSKEILPSKYQVPLKSGSTGTSFNSEYGKKQYDHRRYQPSPPKESYTFTSASSSSSSDIVRPAMRDRSRNRVLPVNATNSRTTLHQRHRSSSSERAVSRGNFLSPIRDQSSTMRVNFRSPDLSDLSSSSSLTTSVSKSDLSSRVSPKLNGTTTRRYDEITIDKHPYSSRYSPSNLKVDTPKRVESPKRTDYPQIKAVASFITEGNGTTGLKNIGNTCFMNSMLQCLSHTVQLRDYCLRRDFQLQINPSSSMRGKLIKAFSDVIKDLWSGTQSSVTPSSFKSQIQKFSPRFMGYDQQDSQEFLRFLLEGLHEDINQVHKKSSEPLKDLSHMRPQEIARETWNWYGKKDKSYIFDLFVGQLESHLQCSYCDHVSLTYDPFWDLSLPISKGGYDSTTLTDCLLTFTKEETLDRDEKPMCERCKTRRRMTKKLSIHRFPKVLVIHLKRFHEGSRYRQKLSNNVKFPVGEPLRLAQFSSDTCEDRFSTSFDLYAVSNHLGSCYGGHYTAFCMNPNSKHWHEFDDSRVSNLSQSLVCTKEAYVLFYVQRCENGRSSRL